MPPPKKSAGSKTVHDKIAELSEQRNEELERAWQTSQAAERNSAKGRDGEAAIYRAQTCFHTDRSDKLQDDKGEVLSAHLEESLKVNEDPGQRPPKP
ncbi:hypothetical protein I6I07_27265 [Achromobacter deleyi]|uniref:Uncharacterized protein n=1 Tax=Achromobacter deleyi TaxID=1353891 RepID=A0A7T4B227_9BURK|nr:hypothetical protein [Achromobacter deleyi]QQB34258.1 hypothetical protein I6I07_27265 [Achromobacter deleyi]